MLTLTQIICEAEAGVLYTSPTGHKVMDHGGFGTDERNVALVISNPHVAGANAGKYFSGPTDSVEIAPTVLSLLGLNPNQLQAVAIEGTRTFIPGIQNPMM